MKNKKNNNKFTGKSKIIFLIAVLLIFFVFGSIWYVYRTPSQNLHDQPKQTSNENKVDMNPATEQDKEQAQQTKEENLQRDSPVSADTTSLKQLQPVIVDAGQYGENIEVSAYIPGIIEDTGTCVVKIKKDAQEVTVSSSALKDATTTRCQNFIIPRNKFNSTGVWLTTVSYSSPAASGNSNVREITIK